MTDPDHHQQQHAGRPAITAGRPLLYTAADLEMVAFLASRKLWKVAKGGAA